jgi:hypothetical protein
LPGIVRKANSQALPENCDWKFQAQSLLVLPFFSSGKLSF